MSLAFFILSSACNTVFTPKWNASCWLLSSSSPALETSTSWGKGCLFQCAALGGIHFPFYASDVQRTCDKTPSRPQTLKDLCSSAVGQIYHSGREGRSTEPSLSACPVSIMGMPITWGDKWRFGSCPPKTGTLCIKQFFWVDEKTKPHLPNLND